MRNFQTENPGYGFHGEMVAASIDAAEAFDLAAKQIAKTIRVDPFDAASWLDSREGRHFGDSVRNHMQSRDMPTAIHAAIGEWLSWNVSSRLSNETGIPEGTPYLVGVVIRHAIQNGA